MIRRSIPPIASALLVALAGCGAAAAPSVSADRSGGRSPSAVEASPALVLRPMGSVEGAPMGYLEYLPPAYGEGEPLPLLVFLHGAGEAGDGSEAELELVDKLGIPRLIADGDWPDEHPFVVLAPQYTTERAEGDCALAEDVAAFVDFASEYYEIDIARVYLTGISCGAIGIWDHLAAFGDEAVAAAVPIAGHAEWALEEAGCAPLTEVPVWAFHGALDDVVPPVHIERPIDQIRACEGVEPVEMELTVYPDADHFDHDAWTRTYDLSAGHDIYAWMLEHSRD